MDCNHRQSASSQLSSALLWQPMQMKSPVWAATQATCCHTWHRSHSIIAFSSSSVTPQGQFTIQSSPQLAFSDALSCAEQQGIVQLAAHACAPAMNTFRGCSQEHHFRRLSQARELLIRAPASGWEASTPQRSHQLLWASANSCTAHHCCPPVQSFQGCQQNPPRRCPLAQTPRGQKKPHVRCPLA